MHLTRTQELHSFWLGQIRSLLVAFLLMLTYSISGQEITVAVMDQVVSKIEKLDVKFSIKEPSALDSDRFAKVSKNLSSEEILAALDDAGVGYEYVSSEMDSTFRMHPIKLKNVSEVRKTLHYKTQLHSLSKIHKFSDVKSKASNLLVTDFVIIDEDAENRMLQIIKDLHAKGRGEAELIAAGLNKKLGKILRIKQLGKISMMDAAKKGMGMPPPKDVTYLTLEITFEAEDN